MIAFFWIGEEDKGNYVAISSNWGFIIVIIRFTFWFFLKLLGSTP
jgi:hypothetical protein